MQAWEPEAAPSKNGAAQMHTSAMVQAPQDWQRQNCINCAQDHATSHLDHIEVHQENARQSCEGSADTDSNLEGGWLKENGRGVRDRGIEESPKQR